MEYLGRLKSNTIRLINFLCLLHYGRKKLKNKLIYCVVSNGKLKCFSRIIKKLHASKMKHEKVSQIVYHSIKFGF